MKVYLRDAWFDMKTENNTDAACFVETDDGRVNVYICPKDGDGDCVVLSERAIHELAKVLAVAEENIDDELPA